MTLNKLNQVIKERKNLSADSSYVAQLFSKGTKKIAEKVGEESIETIIAALQESKEQFIYESADLLFHLSVLWVDRNVAPEEVMAELERRMGISGLDEKAARQAKEKGKA
jgi:phosphoribosyl-ATP pyrophosphohydrolase